MDGNNIQFEPQTGSSSSATAAKNTAPKYTNEQEKEPTTNNDTSFFTQLSENLKYVFNSPLPTTTQFPTPYSSNQLTSQSGKSKKSVNNNSNGVQKENDSSSLMENSILPGLSLGASTNANHQTNKDPSRNTVEENLNDMNIQPSSALQFGSSFPNEFLLTSPAQLKEFLLDSPAPGGFNFFQKTPAKTPLRFVTDSDNARTPSSSKIGFPYTSMNINNTSNNINESLLNSRTPLRKIDLNLMFNSNQLSPSKRLSMSLTPYGRKVLYDIGTPYNTSNSKNNNNNNNNIALVDFRNAKKDDMMMPDENNNTTNNNDSLLTTPRISKHSQKLVMTPNQNTKLTKNDTNEPHGDIYGSSPTTIQLNSSVTKSITKLDAHTIPVLSRTIMMDPNIDEQLFQNELTASPNRRIPPLSPTPKNNLSSKNNNNADNILKILDLPKMGSFKSERTLSIASNKSTVSTVPSSTTADRKSVV